MRRRDFVIGFGAAACPTVVHAQRPERVRLIAMLTAINDPALNAFEKELDKRGWSKGRNTHIEHRYAPTVAQLETLAKELVAMRPDVIFAMSRPATAALQKETTTIPIVFTYVIDPIGAGFVASLIRPGGNLTGLIAYEPSTVGKWLSMLKEIAPQTARVGILGNPKTAVYYDYLLGAAQAAASSLGLEAIPSRIENDAADIERVIGSIASSPNGGMVILPENTTTVNHKLISTLAARHRLPAAYTFKFMVQAGALMSYGIVSADHYRQAAFYVDRILRGAKPAELPVQSPTRYETALNLKTANDLGLTVRPGCLSQRTKSSRKNELCCDA